MNKELPKDLEQILINIGIPLNLFNQYIQEINISYNLGIDQIEKLINRNIIEINPQVLDYLKKYNFELIKNINTELADKLRTTLSRNILEGKPYTQIVSEIKDIFDTTITRARMIARTEQARAFAVGQLEAAKMSSIPLKKYWSAILDNRTSELCLRLAKKYDIDHSIAIDKPFKDDKTGESWLTPPAHINCRSDVIYVIA